ncbi:MAG: acyl carrier protein [Clostridiales bacterium]|nr:acyl carrier protein [Clostridiales bacterium]
MFDKFVEIICNYVEVEQENVHPESRFVEDLGFTSFDFMSMLGELEDEFDIEIDEQEVASILTVQDALDYLATLIS